MVDLASAKFLPPEYLEAFPGYRIEMGDFLIGMSGSLGKIARYVAKEPALQNQRTGLLTVGDLVNREFVPYLFELVEPQILQKGKGVGVQNVSAADIERCTIPLPPREEQDAIESLLAVQFSVIGVNSEAIKKAIRKPERLRQSILKRAFEGRLVPQDPGDEPADKLLDRIRTEPQPSRREKIATKRMRRPSRRGSRAKTGEKGLFDAD